MEEQMWSVGQKLVGLVDRPRATFAQVAARPGHGWYVPAALLFLGILALNAAAAPYAAQEAQAQIQRQLATLPADQAEMVTRQAAQFSSPLFVGTMGLVSGVLGTVVALLLGAGILYLVALFVGGEGFFGATLGGMLWAWVPFGLRAAVQAAIIAIQSRLIVNPGLGRLVSSGDPVKDAQSVLYQLLVHVDLFGLWHLILVYAAALALYRLNRNKAVLTAVLYTIVSLGLRVGIVAIQKMFLPM